MLKLGKINISPWNYFSFSKVLLVPLVVLHKTEQSGVKSHLLACLRLRRFSWALALCPKGSRLSFGSHEKEWNNGEMAGRERNTHNWKPMRAEMEKKLTVMHERKRRQLKSETLASNLPKIKSKRLQSVKNALKSVFSSQNHRNLEEVEENSGEIEAQKSL